MKINFSYKQNEDKFVNRYVSAPLVINESEITDYMYDTAAEMSKAAFGKQIDIVLYDIFEEPWSLKYVDNELYWVRS